MKEDCPFSIIIPVYNEQAGLQKATGQINEFMKRNAGQYEVIFVNDGSTDNSLEILESFDGSDFRIISHDFNKGYGAALKTGIKHAKYDTIVITDSDCTYPINRIPDLRSEYESGNFDMVVGARNGNNVQIPLARKPAKWVLKSLAEYLAGRKIPDLNSG